MAQTSFWKGILKREDGKEIVFSFDLQQQGNKTVLFIKNASERLKVDGVAFTKDSVFIIMPVFESQFKAKLQDDGSWQGVWIKGTAGNDQVMPFYAERNEEGRFKRVKGKSWENITGRWATTFVSDDNEKEAAIGEFQQKEELLTGTFLTASGDYRYLEGIVTGDSLLLSCFDGSHAYLFTATVNNATTITKGTFYAGAKYKEHWSAEKNSKAILPGGSVETHLIEGNRTLDFAFKDLDGKVVSIKDRRFRNKVVIIQIMGSWCPNCMDETAFLSEYYNGKKDKDVEIIALAYEYSTDIERSRKSLDKFRQHFNVKYPILITGVSVKDSLRTQKTLPQLTPIKVFPTTIFLDKKGEVVKIDTEFNGPATGKYYEAYKSKFYKIIRKLSSQ